MTLGNKGREVDSISVTHLEPIRQSYQLLLGYPDLNMDLIQDHPQAIVIILQQQTQGSPSLH